MGKSSVNVRFSNQPRLITRAMFDYRMVPQRSGNERFAMQKMSPCPQHVPVVEASFDCGGSPLRQEAAALAELVVGIWRFFKIGGTPKWLVYKGTFH